MQLITMACIQVQKNTMHEHTYNTVHIHTPKLVIGGYYALPTWHRTGNALQKFVNI